MIIAGEHLKIKLQDMVSITTVFTFTRTRELSINYY